MSSTLMVVPSPATLPDTPYKGLVPFSEDDASFFFGRDEWREIIIDNLKAYPLTLLYGESGVGKSSVLNAGVAYHLREEARRNLAEHRSLGSAVVVFSDWRDNPLLRLTNALHEAVANALRDASAKPETSSDFESTLADCAKRLGGRLFVVLDQFEEYFVYHSREPDEPFANAFPSAAGNRELRVSFLISIREDALAKLDRFKGRIPNLFDNYLRIEHLDREAAREAIEQPLVRFNALRPNAEPIELEPELAEAVLSDVEEGKVQVGPIRGAAMAQTGGQARIETAYLQLVLTRLWQEELGAGSRVLRRMTLERLGGAAGIVEAHLDAAMETLSPDEQDVAADVFRYLVTRSRAKIAHTVTDLAEWTELSETDIAPVLAKLSAGDARILRPVGESSYEIYHDVLGEAVLAWRTKHEAQRLENERRKAEERRQRQVLVVATRLALVGATLLAIGIFMRWSHGTSFIQNDFGGTLRHGGVFTSLAPVGVVVAALLGVLIARKPDARGLAAGVLVGAGIAGMAKYLGVFQRTRDASAAATIGVLGALAGGVLVLLAGVLVGRLVPEAKSARNVGAAFTAMSGAVIMIVAIAIPFNGGGDLVSAQRVTRNFFEAFDPVFTSLAIAVLATMLLRPWRHAELSAALLTLGCLEALLWVRYLVVPLVQDSRIGSFGAGGVVGLVGAGLVLLGGYLGLRRSRWRSPQRE